MRTRIFLSVSIAHFALLGLTMLWMQEGSQKTREALLKNEAAKEVQLAAPPKTKAQAESPATNLQTLLAISPESDSSPKEFSAIKLQRVRFWRRPNPPNSPKLKTSIAKNVALLEEVQPLSPIQAKAQTKPQTPKLPQSWKPKKQEKSAQETATQNTEVALQEPRKSLLQTLQAPQTPPMIQVPKVQKAPKTLKTPKANSATSQKAALTKLPPVPSIQNPKEYLPPQNLPVSKVINPENLESPSTARPQSRDFATQPRAPAASQNRGSILDAAATPYAEVPKQGQTQEQSELNWDFQWDKDSKGQNAARRLLYSPKMSFPRQALQDLKEQSVKIIFQVNAHGRIVSASFASEQLKAYNWQINSYLLEKVRQLVFENSKNPENQILQLSKGIVTFHFTPSQNKDSSTKTYRPIPRNNTPSPATQFNRTSNTRPTIRQTESRTQTQQKPAQRAPAARRQTERGQAERVQAERSPRTSAARIPAERAPTVRTPAERRQAERARAKQAEQTPQQKVKPNKTETTGQIVPERSEKNPVQQTIQPQTPDAIAPPGVWQEPESVETSRAIGSGAIKSKPETSEAIESGASKSEAIESTAKPSKDIDHSDQTEIFGEGLE